MINNRFTTFKKAKEKSELFGTQEISNQFRDILLHECSIIREILNKDLDERASKLKVVLGSNCGTASAICKLSEEDEYYYSESIMLARAFLEKIINFCYLQVCDESEFERYEKYTAQKAYRKLNSSVSIDDFTLGVELKHNIDLKEHPNLSESIDEFTSKKGKPIRQWTNVNVQNRIKLIKERSDINFTVIP